MNESSHRQCVNESENLLKNLSCLRQKHNLTQKQMAHILGIGVHSWQMIERGEMPPRLSARVVLTASDAFGIPAARLFSKTP
ncbi:MAG: helix-turn-helix transcriptional regulator [Ruminococcaceae bacterium]|nr:helix-turn-helix transcriptional regulator [Oscillospiraceae bacterium]